MDDPILVLYGGDLDMAMAAPSSSHGRFDVVTFEKRETGWVVLASEVDCPNACTGGEVWAGEGPAWCGVCGGRGRVLVGFGGARLWRCRAVPCIEEPDDVDYVCEMRDTLLHSAI